MKNIIKYFKLTGNVIALALAASCLALCLIFALKVIFLPDNPPDKMGAPLPIVSAPFYILLNYGYFWVVRYMCGHWRQERGTGYHLLFWSLPFLMLAFFAVSFYGLLNVSFWVESFGNMLQQNVSYFF